MIKCPNPECQAINPEGNHQCASCQSFLPHRYLWALGPEKADLKRLDKRYVWQQQVVLDTEPGIPPVSPDPVPAHIWPYLMLASHGLHVPQPYALLNPGTKRETLLLDAAAIAVASGVGASNDTVPTLLPSLMEAWPTAAPLRQLHWLWQIAGLWSDFTEQQVASSLLSETLLRVHGPLVRLLELSADAQAITLHELGAFWQTLIPKAHTSIEKFLENLCNQLIQGDIAAPDVLIACLDQAIAVAATGAQVEYDLSVLTDQGPSRKRNEDACYPPSGATQTYAVGPEAKPKKRQPLLLLVCDGIGGHEGGDVASQIAIAAIQQQLAPLLDQLSKQPQHDPSLVIRAIEDAIWIANDTISQHNDQGQRLARDRMGTTLVMALIIGAQIYIAHVGDSRAYLVSSNSCRQITFDDDVAAREVRLGYGFYADVVNRPGTGALIQALGMGPSAALHVSVQRLVLDDDLVLLLCSDGLSDYDRVEQSWATYLLPLLNGHSNAQSQVTAAVSDLVQLANTYNGHDNVTVGAISGQIQTLQTPLVPILNQLPTPEPRLTKLTHKGKPTATIASSSQTTVIPQETVSVSQPTKKTTSFWPVLFGLVAVLGTATVLTMVFFRTEPVAAPPPPAPVPPETIQDRVGQDTEIVGITAENENALATPLLTPNSYLQLSQPIDLLRVPQSTEGDNNTLGQARSGAIVQVLTRQESGADQARWVKLKICTVVPEAQSGVQTPTNTQETAPSPSPPTGEANPAISNPAVTPPDVPPLTTEQMSEVEGWVLESQLAQTAQVTERRECPLE